MDDEKVKENYELIKAALREHYDFSSDKLIEVAKYINNMIIDAIKKREYLPVGFDERMGDIKIVRSINKSIIEDIICMPLDNVILGEIADTVPCALNDFYREIRLYDDDDDEYTKGFFFKIGMWLVHDTTINIEIYIKDLSTHCY